MSGENIGPSWCVHVTAGKGPDATKARIFHWEQAPPGQYQFWLTGMNEPTPIGVRLDFDGATFFQGFWDNVPAGCGGAFAPFEIDTSTGSHWQLWKVRVPKILPSFTDMILAIDSNLQIDVDCVLSKDATTDSARAAHGPMRIVAARHLCTTPSGMQSSTSVTTVTSGESIDERRFLSPLQFKTAMLRETTEMLAPLSPETNASDRPSCCDVDRSRSAGDPLAQPTVGMALSEEAADGEEVMHKADMDECAILKKLVGGLREDISQRTAELAQVRKASAEAKRVIRGEMYEAKDALQKELVEAQMESRAAAGRERALRELCSQRDMELELARASHSSERQPIDQVNSFSESEQISLLRAEYEGKLRGAALTSAQTIKSAAEAHGLEQVRADA